MLLHLPLHVYIYLHRYLDSYYMCRCCCFNYTLDASAPSYQLELFRLCLSHCSQWVFITATGHNGRQQDPDQGSHVGHEVHRLYQAKHGMMPRGHHCIIIDQHGPNQLTNHDYRSLPWAMPGLGNYRSHEASAGQGTVKSIRWRTSLITGECWVTV